VTAIGNATAVVDSSRLCPAQFEATLPGRAGQVVRLFGDRLRIVDFYDEMGSAVYHELTRDDHSEVAELTRLLRRCDGAVLELACGAGRLTLPLLAGGREVVAVDKSSRMLELLAERLAGPGGRRLAARLTMLLADMTQIALGRKFGAIVLGTTSVSLLGATERCELFKRVREHLADGGRFFMSNLEVSAPDQTQPVESVEVIVTSPAPGANASRDGDGVQALCTLFEYVDWQRARRFVSVLRQTAVGDPLLATTSTCLIETERLEAELQHCGLTVVDRWEVAGLHRIGAVTHRTVLLEARLSEPQRGEEV